MSNFPVPKKAPVDVYFGNVQGSFRGNPDNLSEPFSHSDDYFWLRDDSRSNQEIIQIINQENLYTKSILEPHEELNQQIYSELLSYMKEDYSTFPTYEYSSKSPYKYFKEFSSGSGYYMYKQLDTKTGLTITLLDVNELAKDHIQCDVTSLSHSTDEKYFSYCVDFDGSEKYKLVIQDIISNQFINTDPIPLISYGDFSWINSNQIVYTQTDSSNRPYQLWLWSIGSETPPSLIFEETNSELSVGFYISTDMKYLFVTSSDYDSSQIYYSPVELIKLVKVTDLIKGFKYTLNHHEGYFYIISNTLENPNWMISRVQVDELLDLTKWNTFIPHNPDVYICSMDLTSTHLFFEVKINGGTYFCTSKFSSGLSTIHMTNLIDFTKDYLTSEFAEVNWCIFWPQTVYVLSIHSSTYDSETIYLLEDSLTKPYTIMEYNFETKSSNIVYTKQVPNYNQELYESKRIYDDKTQVPISLVYKKGIQPNAPTYLYGYGSYGHTIEPNFDYQILPLLDRGWVYAIAHVRGGSFLGYSWYLQGRLQNKMNTFTDFIACAERLINSGYSDPKSITCDGRSAGGLLVGASMVLRPDLFKNVIMGVPFLDVLNTMCDSTIPLTVEEWSQWGNPNIKSDYYYMSLYCPYTNLKPGIKYPNIFATGGLYDPRVQYWEPLKFITKLRALKDPSNTLIQCLKIEMEQGHFGGSDRYKHLKETAEQYTFVLSR